MTIFLCKICKKTPTPRYSRAPAPASQSVHRCAGPCKPIIIVFFCVFSCLLNMCRGIFCLRDDKSDTTLDTTDCFKYLTRNVLLSKYFRFPINL